MWQPNSGAKVGTNLSLALKGFLLCSAPTITAFGALYFLGSIYLTDAQAPELARVFGYSDFEARAAIREDARWVAQQGAQMLLILFAIYWLLAGAIGMRRGLRSHLANVLLFAGSAGFAVLTINRFFYWIEGYCDQLPYPHEGFQPLKFYECPTSMAFLSSLGFLSLGLFIASLAVRVVHSRRTTRQAPSRSDA